MSRHKSVSRPTVGRMAVMREDAFETELRSPMRRPHDGHMMKGRQKISGGFHLPQGGMDLAAVRSFFSQQHLGLDRAFLVCHSSPRTVIYPSDLGSYSHSKQY